MSSFGEEIKRERELREISLREVAEATKINMRYLTALERNEFEHLPGGVFNRGFVRSYAEVIGVDPDAMVNAYLLEEQSQKTQGRGRDKDVMRPPGGATARRSSDGDRASTTPPLLRPLLIAAVLILVVALVLWGTREWLTAQPGPGQETPAVQAVPESTDGEGETP